MKMISDIDYNKIKMFESALLISKMEEIKKDLLEMEWAGTARATKLIEENSDKERWADSHDAEGQVAEVSEDESDGEMT